MEKPEKKILYVWVAGSILTALVISAAISAFVWAAVNSPAAVFGPVFVLSALALTVYNVLRYRSWGFEMKEDHLYLEHGVFKKVKSMVPYVRVQHIDTQRNVIERIAGLSSVVVFTAGSRGADVTLPGLLPEDADRTQEKLRDVAIESEDRDAV